MAWASITMNPLTLAVHTVLIAKWNVLIFIRNMLKKCLESGHAYKCFCTSEELEAEREAQKAAGIAAPMYGGKCRNLTAEEVAEKEAAGLAHTIRMRVPENVTYKVEDLSSRYCFIRIERRR